MQFRSAVLPAPLGPMMARISFVLHVEAHAGEGVDAAEAQPDVLDTDNRLATAPNFASSVT